jgi:hypothetical protein
MKSEKKATNEAATPEVENIHREKNENAANNKNTQKNKSQML